MQAVMNRSCGNQSIRGLDVVTTSFRTGHNLTENSSDFSVDRNDPTSIFLLKSVEPFLKGVSFSTYGQEVDPYGEFGDRD